MDSQHHQHRGSLPEELRERTVPMVFDHQGEYGPQWKAHPVRVTVARLE